MTDVRILAVTGVPEVRPGDDLAALLLSATGDALVSGDVVVVTQKVVSKAEGRLRPQAERSDALAEESRRVLRRSGDMTIAETRHGYVCANAGIDTSNVDGDNVALLPIDPDLSARRLRARVTSYKGIDVGVIISDTFGRPWRLGQTNVAIGIAGIDPFVDYRGVRDDHGFDLRATRIAIADELAGAAEMVMGKTDRVCAAIVRGAPVRWGEGSARALVRPREEDLFR